MNAVRLITLRSAVQIRCPQPIELSDNSPRNNRVYYDVEMTDSVRRARA